MVDVGWLTRKNDTDREQEVFDTTKQSETKTNA
jgi:hypothetical protein